MFYSTDPASQSPFVHCIFGIQYECPPTSSQLHHINTLNSLIDPATDHVERFQQPHSNPESPKSTALWLLYWRSRSAYLAWWDSSPVQGFWNSLPDDAGVWREVMHAKPSRCQYGNSQNVATGMATLSRLEESDKAGFWGSYRARIPDSDFDRFDSPLERLPERRQATFTKRNISRGRAKISGCPKNLCFLREGQYRESITEEERIIWNRDMERHAQDWFATLATNPQDSGLFSVRICQGSTNLPTVQRAAPSLDAKSTQIGYFLDLGHLERAARSLKPHLCLRDAFRRHYGPNGKLSDGKSVIWVEMFVLEPGDFEAEYVGCLENTGFLGYEEDPAFQQAKDAGDSAGKLSLIFVAKFFFGLLIAMVVLRLLM